jgi:putative ABC transport system permease protein
VTGSCPSRSGPVLPSPGAGLPAPRLSVRDTAAEAVAGIVQRPGRSGLTMLGTVLGVGAFVAVLGLTATGAGQISHQFSVLEDTTVSVADNGPANNVAAPGTNPAIGFPADADAIAGRAAGRDELRRLARAVCHRLPDGHPAGRLARGGGGDGPGDGRGLPAERV